MHESNAVPGLATKMVADKVDRILVSFADSRSSSTRATARAGLMCPPVPPQVNTAFMGLPPLTYLGLWVMLRDTFSTMPFSASCMMSAVPP